MRNVLGFFRFHKGFLGGFEKFYEISVGPTADVFRFFTSGEKFFQISTGHNTVFLMKS